jgi:hypothetical protein
MKVFVSYSFVDSELHLISLLLQKLRNEGHYVYTSDLPDYSFHNNDEYKISYSELFIGIITNSSQSVDRVIYDYQRAQNYGIKTILIAEDLVDLRSIIFTDRVIRFNRKNPQSAINQLFGIPNAPKLQPYQPPKKKDYTEEALLGAGILAGVAALIALISSKK